MSEDSSADLQANDPNNPFPWLNGNERPDWPVELDEYITQLGKPIQVFRTSAKTARKRIIYGFFLILVGVIINILYFTLIGKIIVDKILFLILFGLPIMGITIAIRAWRDRGMWVLQYPMGLLHWHRKMVTSLPWSEISEVYFLRLQSAENLDKPLEYDEETDSFWYYFPLKSWIEAKSHLQLNVVRADGVKVYLSSAMNNFGELGDLIQKKTLAKLWPNIKNKIDQFEPITDFPGIYLDYRSLNLSKKESLDWTEFGGIKIINDRLLFYKEGKWRSWGDLPAILIPNLHILITTIYYLHNFSNRALQMLTDNIPFVLDRTAENNSDRKADRQEHDEERSNY